MVTYNSSLHISQTGKAVISQVGDWNKVLRLGGMGR